MITAACCDATLTTDAAVDEPSLPWSLAMQNLNAKEAPTGQGPFRSRPVRLDPPQGRTLLS